MVLSTRPAPPGPAAASRTALWVVPVSDLGGVARHVVDVFRYAAAPAAPAAARAAAPAAGLSAPAAPAAHALDGWRLVLLCPPGPLAEAVARVGGQLEIAPIGPTAGLRESLASLRAAVRRWRPDVVHSHLAYADIVAALATPRGIPLVCTEHGIADDDRVYHSSGALLRLMADVHRLRLARLHASGGAIIAVSEATAAAIRRKWHPHQPITVLHNGVDRPAGSGAAPGGIPGRLRVASIARLAPEKRLDALLEAFALLRHSHPHATLTLAGTGPIERQLRAQIGRLGLAEAVQLPGHVEAAALLARTDVVAQLSLWENCSYTLLDAVVAGVGVVASPVGGNPEILPRHCLVDPADPLAVAERIESQAQPGASRPQLPPGWPTVADMCHQLVGSYPR